MAVFTPVALSHAQALFTTLGLGAIRTMTPTEGGIENTNYFVDADSGRWVLTVFERLHAHQLPFYLGLMHHLAERGLPVPKPCAASGGELVQQVVGKPAAVVPRLPGEHQDAPDIAHVAQVGAMLARLHEAAADLPLQQANLRGLAWWQQTVPVVLPHLAAPEAELLASELRFIEHAASTPAWQSLPRGPIHADLFRDNVMFAPGADGADRISGLLDFYFAGVDTWLFDIAVCLNDWCIDPATGRLDEAPALALLGAYQTERRLTPVEWRMLPTLLRAAALRFWLSRLWDWHLPRDAAVLSPKDPTHFERILRERRAAPWHPELS
jgi:homoserine kinase type II